MGARWAEWAVQRLVGHGHQFRDIPDYTLQQVAIFLDAIEREEAATRASFLTDLAAVLGGVLGGSDVFADHLDDIVKRQTEGG